jgi:hypothetical protein
MMKKEKMIEEMVEGGFENEKFLNELNDDDVMKKYKCFLSRKCNDEKFMRIKKMFEYVKDDKDFVEFIGKEEYNKLVESYGKKEKRGEVVRVEFGGMSLMEVFEVYKMGVKEVCKKGYIVENDMYKKV